MWWCPFHHFSINKIQREKNLSTFQQYTVANGMVSSIKATFVEDALKSAVKLYLLLCSRKH